MSVALFTIVRRCFGANSATRNLIASALVAGIAMASSGAALASKPEPLPDAGTLIDAKPIGATWAEQKPDAHVLILLTQPAAVEAYAAALKASGGSPTNVTGAAVSAGRVQIDVNAAQQVQVVGAMQSAGIQFSEIYRVQRAMNAVAVIVPAAQVGAIRKIEGVKSVRPIVPMEPTSNSSTAFVGAPKVWQGASAGSPATANGTGIKVGIIDTGVDYQHADFGGLGTLAVYQDNDRVSTTGTVSGTTLFPTAKVAGGYDFAGDSYNAAGSGAQLIPVPDANPTDCLGHGSHVAGTAGGFGVDSAGATFAGPYNTSLPADLRIQPGIAPKATLYAIKIFGCAGSTDLTVAGIDWALDPNGDGDLSDHLDVINMSLGSPNGSLSNIDVEASDAASLSGMIVVASAGNSYDSYLIVGAPSISARTISVAASYDGGEPAYFFSVSAPAVADYYAVAAGFGPTVPPAVLSGNVAYNGTVGTPYIGCGVNTAIPNVSGKIALIDRGTCSFQTKVHNAELGLATGVIVVQSTTDAPISMGGDATVATPTIPSAMISKADGAVIKAQLAVPQTVTGALAQTGTYADTLASFSSRGPVQGTPTSLKPDITAPGVNIVSVTTGMTCTIASGLGCFTPTASGFDPGNLAVAMSGTSMAAPQVAGLMALLRQLHPTLTVEEMKALAVNGSLHDLTTLPAGAGVKYGAGRVGAGRIDAVTSANLAVTAYNADASGAVSISFPSEIGASTTVTRKLHVKNLTLIPTTFTLGIDTIVDNPGISFSLPGGTSLTLAAGQTKDVDVQMSGSASLLTNNHDLSIALTQTTNAGTLARYWMPEETAYLTVSSGGSTLSRVPLYVAPYPAASMSGGTSVPTGGAASGSTAIPLTGTGICTGTLIAGPGCAGSWPTDEESLVTPFELQAENARNPTLAPESNLHYAGVTASATRLRFGIALWGPAPIIASETSTAVEVTIIDGAGNPLYTLYPYTAVLSGTSSTTNVYVTAVYQWGVGTTVASFANAVDSTCCDTRIFQNNVFFMSASLTSLGLTAGSTFKYIVETYGVDGSYEKVGPFTYHLGAKGLDFGGSFLLEDLPGATIPVAYNVANLTANGSRGALLLHHHNAAGSTAQVLTVPTLPVAPILISAASRKVQGGAGTYSLPLTLVASGVNHIPATEPRAGPTQMLVFTFDKAVTAGGAVVSEGIATVGTIAYVGNEMRVPLTAVTDRQYVTVDVSAVVALDGGTGGVGSARVGLLAGNVTQTRVGTLADLLTIAPQLTQLVTGANYLLDVDANGSITLSDLMTAAPNIAQALPAP